MENRDVEAVLVRVLGAHVGLSRFAHAQLALTELVCGSCGRLRGAGSRRRPAPAPSLVITFDSLAEEFIQQGN